MRKLSDDELDNIGGGMLFYSVGIVGADPDKPWEVIDNNGNVIDRFKNKDDAIKKAREHSSDPLNTLEINWTQLCYLRKK